MEKIITETNTNTVHPPSTLENAAAAVKSKIAPLANRADHAVDSATTNIGWGLTKAADKVAETTGRATDGVQAAGTYLQNHDTKDLGRDLSELVRRHPKASLAAGLGIGFLAVRLFSRK